MNFYAWISGLALALLAWLLYELKKLKKLENKELLDEMYKQAHDDVASKSLDELVNDTNKRIGRGRPNGHS